LREDVIILNSGEEEETPLLLIPIVVGGSDLIATFGETTTNAFAALMKAVIEQKRYIEVAADCFILFLIDYTLMSYD
jgi:hypothetical protein